jgi:predicted NBD/HSP70 family sugar kinase
VSVLLGIDLGGTRLRAAVAGPAPVEPVALGDEPAPASVEALVERVSAHAAAGAPLAGIGITVPGLVDGTVCRWVPNLPYLDGVDLADALSALGTPVVAGNDAQLALLAEASQGAAAGSRDALLLAVGTGIGSAVLCEGRIARGSHGGACSFGWACADAGDAGHARLGWLERQASGRALDVLGAGLDPPRDARGLISAARAGDPAAVEALDGVADVLGTTLAGAVALLDPEVVLVAGGVAAALDVLGPALRAALDRRLPAHLHGVPVRAGAFGPDAGIVGALLAARTGAEWWDVRG